MVHNCEYVTCIEKTDLVAERQGAFSHSITECGRRTAAFPAKRTGQICRNRLRRSISITHSLYLSASLSISLSISISVSFKSRLQDSQLNTIEQFFVAQKALALTELSPSLSFACLTKTMTNAGMRETLGCECVEAVEACCGFWARCCSLFMPRMFFLPQLVQI